MLAPEYPYTRHHARTYEWTTYYIPRSDSRYRRRCSTCHRFLSRDRKGGYCKRCQARRVQQQRVRAYEKNLREQRIAWRATINLEALNEDDWWLYLIEPNDAQFLDWIRRKYAYAFVGFEG